MATMASASAVHCASAPASAAGAVAPACGAVQALTGSPRRAASHSTAEVSGPKRSGETIGTHADRRERRRRNAPSRAEHRIPQRLDFADRRRIGERDAERLEGRGRARSRQC